ncbi:MAG: beta-glucosidase [Oscillatoria sp. SIO1A7]|nr:beta-glucosidase [Oscillatoria sp. SIO1A7]
MLPDIENLSLAEQVAQMFVVRISGHLFDSQIEFPWWEPPAAELEHWLQDLGVGGVILVGGSAGDLMLRSRQVQSWAKYPLLVAADVEEGVGQRFAGATWFPPPMALRDIAIGDPDKAAQYARKMGAFIAKESLGIGLNWVLAPVVDVNNNPENPVINVRSFGETPDAVGFLAEAFIQGARDWSVLTCAKHFPGHGDTSVDSHLDLPVIPHSRERLAEIELPPFARAIAAGVDSVMSAHLVIECWDPEQPATLSEKILTGKLRNNLGFEGLIVTDALVMGAIAKRYGSNEAPVMALEAGADILLMPADPPGAIQAVLNAVESGRISPKRIRDSVERIWQAKRKVCASTTPGKSEPETISSLSLEYAAQLDLLANPVTKATAGEILQESLRVGGAIPWQPVPGTGLRNLIVVDDVLRCSFLGHHVPAIAIPKEKGALLQIFDRDSLAATEGASNQNPVPTLLQLFIRGNPFRGTAGLTKAAEDLLERLLRNGELQALAIYGSPYILERFLTELPSEIPYVFSYGQMPKAQAIALEALFGS